MPPIAPKIARVNGIEISYIDQGQGPLVVMVMGTGAPGRVWHAHQQPALIAAGYRVVTFDNRGIAPTSECAEGFALSDMVADTAALIEFLDAGPAHVIGTSLGGRITAELCVARPDLVASAVIIASYGRSTPLQAAMSRGEREIYDRGIELPEDYHAAVTAQMSLSPATLADESAVRDWLDVIGFSGSRVSAGVRAQMGVHDDELDRLGVYGTIAVPVLVIGFADDRTLLPHLSRELADAITGARYEEVADAGHWGYLEQPATVNALLIDFLA
ncbi:alpha/beta fold hydrolase [Gordonia jinhuaensis]|uniref:Hydrolase n=1 Tax=Gordonia jinhuaensis TaxID=1517702 RepID=A0A916SYY1_9ACTN|nr:alpha/beta hydrolase [Gordonia jinhuaensis]GGB22746.1 hydrolase [Gordonia jinhuaensis]